MALKPVLQIIHISDLHVQKTGFSDAAKFYQEQRVSARWLRDFLKRHDLLGWEGGTQGHYPKAPESFGRFLAKFRAKFPIWFGEGENPGQTWLVDTGDLTTFGDARSIALGKGYHEDWEKELGTPKSRQLYGNHDAWPGCHPGPDLLWRFSTGMEIKRSELGSELGWLSSDWISAPLMAPIPGTKSRIELYGFDTVVWNRWLNVLAIGTMPNYAVDELRRALTRQLQQGEPHHFRIVAMHHPIAFPYRDDETRASSFLPGLPSNRILDPERCGRILANDANTPNAGPLAHVILSGHTHAQYPWGQFPADAGGVKQGPIRNMHMQLVGGPLMLNRVPPHIDDADSTWDSIENRPTPNYNLTRVDFANCQAQLLRFYSDPDAKGVIRLRRWQILAESGGRRYYVVWSGQSETDIPFHS
jgi:Calcineurin-like phosphoesterase